jgi:hypothetical protein
LFDAFDRSGLRWSLLRPREALAHPGGDVDVLGDPVSLPLARSVLAEQAFVAMNVGGADLHAADFDPDAGTFLWIHVQSELRMAGVTVAADDVLAAVTPDAPPQPVDVWLVWILLLRGLLEKRDIPRRYREYLASTATAAPTRPPGPLAEVAARSGLDPGAILALARDRNWAELLLPDSAPCPVASPVCGATRASPSRSSARTGPARQHLSPGSRPGSLCRRVCSTWA